MNASDNKLWSIVNCDCTKQQTGHLWKAYVIEYFESVVSQNEIRQFFQWIEYLPNIPIPADHGWNGVRGYDKAITQKFFEGDGTDPKKEMIKIESCNRENQKTGVRS